MNNLSVSNNNNLSLPACDSSSSKTASITNTNHKMTQRGVKRSTHDDKSGDGGDDDEDDDNEDDDDDEEEEDNGKGAFHAPLQKYFRDTLMQDLNPASWNSDQGDDLDSLGSKSRNSNLSHPTPSRSLLSGPGLPLCLQSSEISQVFKNKLTVKGKGLQFSWNNLTAMAHEHIFSLKGVCRELQDNFVTPKKVLENLCGSAHSGEITAILATSGVARSMLMNVISCRHSSRVQVTGDRSINAVPVDQRVIHKFSSFVQHKDSFVPLVTVREHLIFAATLSMRPKTSQSDRLKRVDRVLREVGLSDLKDFYIGFDDCRSPSTSRTANRGQRKLVSLAAEFLTDSPIIFCETPVLDMDMPMALLIMQSLRAAAHLGKIVIVTEQRPSSEIFFRYDQIYLLTGSSTAKLAFQGTATEALDFFQKLGFTCPSHHNPSDFLLRTVASLEEEQEPRLNELEDSEYVVRAFQSTEKYARIQGEAVQSKWKSVSTIELENKLFKKALRYRSSWYVQLYWLYKREISILFRHFFPFYGRILITIVSALVFGLIFWQQQRHNGFGIDGVITFFGISVVYNFILSVTHAIFWMSSHLEIAYRENYKNLYRPEVYYLVKNLVDLPIIMVQAWIFVLVTYPMVGLGDPLSSSFQYGVLVYTLLSLTTSALGYMFVMIWGSALLALKFTHSDLLIHLVYSGLLLDRTSVFRLVGFLNNISIPFQIIDNLVEAQWTNEREADHRVNSSRHIFETSRNIWDASDLPGHVFWFNYYTLLAVALGFRVVAVIPFFLRVYLWGKFTPDK